MSAPAPERGARLVPALAAGYLLALLGLALVPGSATDDPGSLLGLLEPELQNLLHVPLYALLAWLWCRAFEVLGCSTRIALALGVALPASYALFEEWLQTMVPGRYSSMTDVLLDLAGIALGAGWFAWTRRRGARRAWAR